MYTESHASMTTTISEALEAHPDLDELHDERFVRLHIRELFELRGAEDAGVDEGDDALEDVWAYLLTTREQLAFLAYLCVRKGTCVRKDLNLEQFEDQEGPLPSRSCSRSTSPQSPSAPSPTGSGAYSSPSSPRASGTLSNSACSSGRIG